MKFTLYKDIFKIIFIYDKNFLLIKIYDNNCSSSKYKSIQIEFKEKNKEELNFDEIDKIRNEISKEQAACPCSLSDLVNIYSKEKGKKYLVFIIPKEDNSVKRVEKEIQLLNVKYYITIGSDNKRLNNSPYYTYLEKDDFNLNDIKKLIEKENLDNIYEFDSYKIKNQYGYFEKIGYENSEISNSGITLEFHCNSIKKQPLLDGIDNDQQYTGEILKLKDDLNKYSQNVINYDLIYLYASPIVSKGQEDENPISYREEIEIILNIMKKKGKKFNCLFECIGSKTLKEILTNKKTKVLHISSHGMIERKSGDTYEYSLLVEDVDEEDKSGKKIKLTEQTLTSVFKLLAHKIKDIDVVILSTCHSGGLKEMLEIYKPKNIIYVDKKTEIGDYTSVKFTEYFYQELLDGRPIHECYKTSIEKLKCDTDILFYNIDRCCCAHFHSNQCKFRNSQPNDEYHKKYHIKSEKCKCKYEECHTHDKDCKFALELKEEIAKNNVHIIAKEYDNYIKFCCCDPNVSHNEILKLKYDRYDEEKYKEINIFKYNSKGKIKINDNVSTDFDAKRKYYFIIGRKVLVSEIFEKIFKNKNDNFFIILYGEKGLYKQNFAESTCVFLFERKIIHKYEIYAIKSDLDYNKMKDKIFSNENINSHNKSVKIIKFYNIENYEHSKDNIKKLADDFQKYKNLYFIILCDLELSKNEIEELEKMDKLKVKCFNARIRKPILLLKYFYRIYNPNCGLRKKEEEDLAKALENINVKPKQLEAIAKLLTIGETTVDEIISDAKNNLKNISYEGKPYSLVFDEKSANKLSQYYLLSKFPSGLPNSFISIIFQGIEKNMKAENKERLIKVNTKNDWKYINSDINIENIEKLLPYAKKYFIKTLKLYAILLDYYIDKKRNEVNFKDDNIHIIFNSFNTTEIWKSHIKDLLKNEKDEKIKNIDVNIFDNKNYIIMKHRENISSLLNYIVNNLEFFLSEDEDDNIKKYLEEILILYPSALFFKKACKDILQMCKCFCNKCIKYLENKNVNSSKSFAKLENKLLIFQYSIGEIENINPETLEEDLTYEYNFLQFLISKSIKQESRNIKEIIKSGKLKDKKKLSILNYELAKMNFSIGKKNEEETENNLNSAIENMLLYICGNFNEQINAETSILFKKFYDKMQNKETDLSKFSLEIKYLFRMIIDLCQVFKLKEYSDDKDSQIQQKIDYLDKIINLIKDKESNLYKEANILRTELYNLKQPDIVILNSNPIKDNFSLLSTGIYANLNNQYYILKQLKEINDENKDNDNDKDKQKPKETETESYMRIKSLILNRDNLYDSLNNKGEILIIQSDDFNDNGDIILESDDGKSEVLPKDELFELIKEKIEYKVLILCFNNSSKLLESIQNNKNINYECIISFEYFNSYFVDKKSLVEYNKLCIQFIIDYIKISSKYNNINVIFEKAKNKFLENKKNKFLDDIPGKDFIFLTKKNRDSFIQIDYFQKKQEIFLYENLPEITENYEYNNYYFEFEDIINEINNNDSDIKFCCEKKKKRFIKIGIELIKYYFRHKTFDFFYEINLKNISFDSFKKLVKSSKAENKRIFYFIYNCKEDDSLKNILSEIEAKKDKYLILYDQEHKDNKCDSEINSDSESDDYKLYSAFSLDDGEESDSDEINKETIVK